MSTRRGLKVPDVWIALSLLVLGGLAGIVIDRIRFEPWRAAMLAHVEAVIKANQGTPLAVGPVGFAASLGSEPKQRRSLSSVSSGLQPARGFW